MEVLNLLKFWKTSQNHDEEKSRNSPSTTISHSSLSIDGSDSDVDEKDDSFFELDLTDKNRDTKEQSNIKNGDEIWITQNEIIFNEENRIPIEPNLKPSSPISTLKSGPKLRIFMLGFKSSMARKTEEHRVSTETSSSSKASFEKERGSPYLPIFTRVNSSRTSGSKWEKQSMLESSTIDSSKRFSKDAVQKYLKLVKPLYVKISRRYSDRVKLSDLMYSVSPASSPIPASSKNGASGFRVLGKKLGKSKSALAVVGVLTPATCRRDDSLLEHDDGIQSAILHCKRSFNSSRRESCPLSRCSSDSPRRGDGNATLEKI